MKITIKTESDHDIVSSPVICGISIDGVMSQNDVRDALSEIDKFAKMFFDKRINKYGDEPDPHDFCANAKPCVLHSYDQLRKENHELKEWCDKLNECCNSLESEVQMLKAKIYDIQNKEK